LKGLVDGWCGCCGCDAYCGADATGGGGRETASLIELAGATDEMGGPGRMTVLVAAESASTSPISLEPDKQKTRKVIRRRRAGVRDCAR
jgi:hypothetical protein